MKRKQGRIIRSPRLQIALPVFVCVKERETRHTTEEKSPVLLKIGSKSTGAGYGLFTSNCAVTPLPKGHCG